jgi:predicted dehydrogenase
MTAEERNNVNFAIVGFGGIGKVHAISAHASNLTLSLPYNLNLTKTLTRKSINSTYGVKNTQDIEEVLSDPEISFIDICTPNDSHCEVVKQAIKYNKPIYCEKPLSSSYKEAMEMTEFVKESGVKNAVALIYRFVPAVRLIREELEDGSIGEIIDFKIKLYHKSYLDPNKKKAWRMSQASGGGALLDLGIHLVDIVQFTIGEIEKVKAETRIFFEDRTSVDEIASCELKLYNGIRGNLEVSRIFADSEESTTFVIYGTKGSIRMRSADPMNIEIYDFNKNITYKKSAKGNANILKYYGGSSMGFFYDSHKAALVNFAEIVLGNNVEEGITPTFEDGLSAQRVVEASYISGREKREVSIEEL